MYMNTRDLALKFEDKHLLVKKINYMITITISKTQHPIMTSSQPYHSLNCINTAPEIIMVTRNIQFTMVRSPHLMMQTSRIHQTVFW